MDDSGIESETKTFHQDDKQSNRNDEHPRTGLPKNFVKPSRSCKMTNKLEMERVIDEDDVIFFDKTATKPIGNMLPLQRLSIPNVKFQQPLVEWESDDSDETINFYGMTDNATTKKANAIDTFSIEELSITDDDEAGDNLNLVTPEYDRLFFCCRDSSYHEQRTSCAVI